MILENVSIIIPIYNAKNYVEKCIASILKQTYSNWLLLLIDDGSTDGTSAIIDKYSEKYCNIYVYHKENGGSASARNFGLKLVRTEYLVFIDADDTVHPQYIELLYESLIQNNADIAQCDFKKTDTQLVKTNEQILNESKFCSGIEFLKEFCQKSTYLRTAVLWNKIFKTALFTNLSFPENKGIDDEYLICHVISRAKKVAEISNVLYYYHMSPNSQMRTKPSLKSIDSIEAIECQLELFKNLHQPQLYNMLLYRYYSSISWACEFLKSFFPEETELLKNMMLKKRKWKKTLLTREISFVDKMFLIIRMNFPKFFEKIHKVVAE